MSAMLIRNARVLTMLALGETRPPPGGRRGGSLGELGVIPAADVLLEFGKVSGVWARNGAGNAAITNIPSDVREIHAHGRVLMPGFVDCHTHACWAGSRIDEWERKLAGATYQEIMASGGGIMSTVRAVRDASETDLFDDLAYRVERMLELGTTTVEVKSGYGLTLEHELKMLRVIQRLDADMIVTVASTALLGHAVEGDAGAFVNETLRRTLPGVSAENPGVTVDAFCEKGAWGIADCVRLFEAARAMGHPIRVHADQFTSMGMVERAIELGARSVDHLEASTSETLAALARSETFGVGLPVCGFHLDGRYARLGELAAMGGKVCIATNSNPGSAPCPSMAFAIALAVRHCGLAPAQAIVAATVNPATLLGLHDRGYIAPGARADLLLLRHTDERALAYEVGDNPVDEVIVGGEIVV